uniref:Uncharacterized protein n=1 Tax=Manihot esculenta TaxID=3983 RepID=A0A2C9VFV1_MANES
MMCKIKHIILKASTEKGKASFILRSFLSDPIYIKGLPSVSMGTLISV